ncbi:MAG: SDR family NAD(P)-dependent oxidoreductase, partial [Verrucomicrobiota bacterium]
MFSLFRLFKSLIARDLVEGLRLKVVTRGVHRIHADDSIDPRAAGLHGFTMSLGRELQGLEASWIDIDNADAATAERIVAEPPHPKGEGAAIRSGRRYERRLLASALPAGSSEAVPHRTRGVYFVLGGSGGIGLELARRLTESVQARVVLVGRSPLDERRQTALSAIGGEILYLQADATDPESMKAAVAQATERFGPIHGVFHSAITLKDKTLENMDEATLRMATDAKIRGSAVLVQVFENHALDFMMFFSSALSFSGNAGQANYAAGCTFKDAYAHAIAARVRFPVKIMNWGYWGTVGIVASELYNKRLAAAGLFSIQPEQGMEAVERLLSSPATQTMFINANESFLEDINVDTGHHLLRAPESNLPCLEGAMDRSAGAYEEPERIQTFYQELDRLGALLALQCFQKAGVFT